MTKEREALNQIAGFTLSQFMGPHDMALECVNVARDALARPEQEPVAWRWGVPKLKNGDFEWRYSLNQTRPDAIPLYTTPTQRTWVGLTGFEQKELMAMSARDAVFATEAKLRSKNT